MVIPKSIYVMGQRLKSFVLINAAPMIILYNLIALIQRILTGWAYLGSMKRKGLMTVCRNGLTLTLVLWYLIRIVNAKYMIPMIWIAFDV